MRDGVALGLSQVNDLLPRTDLTWSMVQSGDLLLRWDEPNNGIAVVLDENTAVRLEFDGKYEIVSLPKPSMKGQECSLGGWRVWRP